MVCLPSAHKGGELAVRHDGREVLFDWSNDAKSVQWAAFYSDCEHEVLPVSDGYRVTLTYNLYYSERGEQICPSMNWKTTALPLYQIFSEVLQSKDFLPQGKNFFRVANRKVVLSESTVTITMHTRRTSRTSVFPLC